MNTPATWHDYLELCKPRVVLLMLATAVIAMILATPNSLTHWSIMLAATVGIGLAACAGGTLNHIIDQRIDSLMGRTQNRPLPSGRINTPQALLLALILSLLSLTLLWSLVNTMTALLSLGALVGYAGIYTLFLKRATPQNIVIGGLAGAMPPLLGWVAMTGHINGHALLLVLIIFTWTPPHFWALAIARHKEYQKANIPMLPVIYGLPFTRLNVLLYTWLMVAVTYLPVATDMAGLIYCIGATLLNGVFLAHAYRLYRYKDAYYALATFRYSIVYLFLLFVFLLVDHYYPLLV